MGKKLLVFSFIFILVIAIGAVLMPYFYGRGQSEHVFRDGRHNETTGRVEKLQIDPSISKYFDDNLDLTAFAPGSGWLKFISKDKSSPVLHFDSVSQTDIQKFNRFLMAAGAPLKVAFSNSVLYITSVEKIDGSIDKNKGNKAPHMVLRRDESGRVFLVSVAS